MICVLRVYENQPVPDLPYGVTLNTVISILSTGSKSSLLFVVGECMGQLKWVAFQSLKPIVYLQAYDSASRGPLGSFLILFQNQWSSLVTVGSFIMILALTFDPFVQQIIKYPLQEVTGLSPGAAVKQSYFLGEGNQAFTDASNAALWTDNFAIDPGCSSGNCSWPLFQSVEWCSKCEDVTSDATLVGCDIASLNTSLNSDQTLSCNVSLSQGSWAAEEIDIFYANSPAYYDMEIHKDFIWNVDTHDWADGSKIGYAYSANGVMGSNISLTNKTYVGVENPLYVVAHGRLALSDDYDEPGWPSKSEKPLLIQQVTQCILSPCARTYKLSVSGGKTSSKVSVEDYGSFYVQQFDDYMDGRDGPESQLCWKPGTKSPSGGSEDYFKTNDGQYVKPDDMAFCVGDSSSFGIAKVIGSGLNKMTQSLVASLSKLARDSSGKVAIGFVSNEESYVTVNWPWLTLPAMLLLLGVILLISTILINKHKKLGLWKTSILPALYHGIEKDSIGVDGEYKNVSEMDHSARNVDVMLDSSDTQGRLVLRKR
ncbi:hypothetical protein N7540_000160 [Penicillium herquei]|nr:hypothetical protein N7540_000160 [Penicillium herquei]